MTDVVNAVPFGKRAVLFETSDGERFLHQDGSLSWRNNNPGNIVSGAFAKRNGAVGQNGRFAVFPDVETGRLALNALLTGKSYADLPLGAAMQRYAPSHENDTEAYIGFIESKAGLQRDQKIKSMTEDERKRLVGAIERFEGFKVGRIVPLSADDANFV